MDGCGSIQGSQVVTTIGDSGNSGGGAGGEDVRRLQSERDELAATVEALREAYAAYVESGFDEILEDAFAATPQQHLRDVLAEAGRAGFVAGCIYADDIFDICDSEAANNYAERVKAGEA